MCPMNRESRPSGPRCKRARGKQIEIDSDLDGIAQCREAIANAAQALDVDAVIIGASRRRLSITCCEATS